MAAGSGETILHLTNTAHVFVNVSFRFRPFTMQDLYYECFDSARAVLSAIIALRR